MAKEEGPGTSTGGAGGCGSGCECAAELEQARQQYAALKMLKDKNSAAWDTHDALAQGLGAILWQLNAIELHINDHRDAADLLLEVKRAQDLARELLREAQDSVRRLRM